MKTLYLTAIALIALVFSVSYSINSYSSNLSDDMCKCCDSTCVQSGCCVEGSGSSQGNANCCTDKCTSEKCKECCSSGKCTMMKSDNTDPSGKTMGMSDKMTGSCCKAKDGEAQKNCCK